jgi:hypothetical protein
MNHRARQARQAVAGALEFTQHTLLRLGRHAPGATPIGRAAPERQQRIVIEREQHLVEPALRLKPWPQRRPPWRA